MAWLEAEHATLLATQRAAVALGRHHLVWHLAWNLDIFHHRRGHRRDGLTVWRAALDAAAHLPDNTTRSRTHRLLGNACSRLGLHEEAAGHLDQALALAVHHHDPTEQAHIHRARDRPRLPHRLRPAHRGLPLRRLPRRTGRRAPRAAGRAGHHTQPPRRTRRPRRGRPPNHHATAVPARSQRVR